MLPGFSAQQSWPGCPVTTAASGSATLGGEEEAGHDLERLVAGWLAGCAFSAVLAPACHLPQAVREGKWRLHSNAYCLSFSWEQSQKRERLWQHLIQGADVRGNILIHKTLALGFSREPQRLSSRVLERVHEGRREILGSWDPC